MTYDSIGKNASMLFIVFKGDKYFEKDIILPY